MFLTSHALRNLVEQSRTSIEARESSRAGCEPGAIHRAFKRKQQKAGATFIRHAAA
jgi:hypothetical protein